MSSIFSQYGIPKRRLNGHSHFVSDVVISSDGQFCLSGSWDGTLRLWDLASGNTTRRFIGHTKVYILSPISFFSHSKYYRMSSLSPSQLTIVKLCLPLATVPSSCGTLWVFASTPSKNKVTPNGYLASDSHHLPKTLSLFPLAGISWSKSGIFPTASSSATTTVTLDT